MFIFQLHLFVFNSNNNNNTLAALELSCWSCFSCETSEQENTLTATVTSASHVVTEARSPSTLPPPAPVDSRCGGHVPPTLPVCEEVPPPNMPQASDHSGKRSPKRVAMPLESIVSFSCLLPSLLSGYQQNLNDCPTSAPQQPEGDYDVLPCRKSQRLITKSDAF